MPRTLSSEQVEEFRARLLAVAQHRFATQGRDAVSMRQLADALGCSPMTPYRYFHNKDEILAAVRAAAFDRFAAALEGAVTGAGGDLSAAGQGVGQAYVQFAREDPDGYRLMFDVSQPNTERYPDLMRASSRARATMTGAIRALVDAGIFHGHPELLGLAFWSAMHGLVMLHLAGKLPVDLDFEIIRREIMRLLVTGARAAA